MSMKKVLFSLVDRSPGYEVSPGRVPMGTLSNFAAEVKDFVKGGAKDIDVDSLEVAVVSGSLAIEINSDMTTNFWDDLTRLASSFDLKGLDEKRRLIVEKWQAQATKKEDVSFKIGASTLSKEIVVSKSTKFRIQHEDLLVDVERYIRGEVLDLGGVTKPNAHIRLPDGKSLLVRTDRDQIRSEKTNHLYKQVYLRIKAKYNLETGELTDAQLIEFVEHAPKFDQDAFERLTMNGLKAWADVPDPAKWVRELRGEVD